jgi:hypothetical protein
MGWRLRWREASSRLQRLRPPLDSSPRLSQPGIGDCRRLRNPSRPYRGCCLDYAKEWRIGDFLASSLGPLVPQPVMHAEPQDGLLHGAIVYKKLPGMTPTWGVDPVKTLRMTLGHSWPACIGCPLTVLGRQMYRR